MARDVSSRRLAHAGLLLALLAPFPVHALECPAGSIETLDTVAGPVCRYFKSGMKVASPNADGTCPDTYRLESYRGSEPACISAPIDAAERVAKSNPDGKPLKNCDAGYAPVIASGGEVECQQNLAMKPYALFQFPTDCPSDTTYTVQSDGAACRQR